jgi:hypothetical protein
MFDLSELERRRRQTDEYYNISILPIDYTTVEVQRNTN